jgi:hypothetical protein
MNYLVKTTGEIRFSSDIKVKTEVVLLQLAGFAGSMTISDLLKGNISQEKKSPDLKAGGTFTSRQATEPETEEGHLSLTAVTGDIAAPPAEKTTETNFSPDNDSGNNSPAPDTNPVVVNDSDESVHYSSSEAKPGVDSSELTTEDFLKFWPELDKSFARDFIGSPFAGETKPLSYSNGVLKIELSPKAYSNSGLLNGFIKRLESRLLDYAGKTVTVNYDLGESEESAETDNSGHSFFKTVTAKSKIDIPDVRQEEMNPVVRYVIEELGGEEIF